MKPERWCRHTLALPAADIAVVNGLFGIFENRPAGEPLPPGRPSAGWPTAFCVTLVIFVGPFAALSTGSNIRQPVRGILSIATGGGILFGIWIGRGFSVTQRKTYPIHCFGHALRSMK